MEKAISKSFSPFIVPPPKLTFHEELLKKNYDLQISNLENQIRLQKDMMKSKDEMLLGQAKRINELSIQVQNNSTKKDHSECIKKINEMIKHLTKSKSENDLIKTELFKCKFKEKHKEGYEDFNKSKDFDRKCVAIEIENLHMKSEIDQLRKLNEEKVISIKKPRKGHICIGKQ